MPSSLTHLTFQHHRAGEAVEFYTRLVPGSSIDSRAQLSADCELLQFTISGRPFIAADSPPVHAWDFTPAMSIYLSCDDAGEVDRVFDALAEGGEQFMPLGDYGFNPRFGWCKDPLRCLVAGRGRQHAAALSLRPAERSSTHAGRAPRIPLAALERAVESWHRVRSRQPVRACFRSRS